MRLIDADALLEKVWDVDCRCGYVQVVDRADIETAPTIDPEDLRPKGEWVRPTKIDGRTFNVPHCSACGGVPCGVDEHTHFCPNCGADMRGGDDGQM